MEHDIRARLGAVGFIVPALVGPGKYKPETEEDMKCETEKELRDENHLLWRQGLIYKNEITRYRETLRLIEAQAKIDSKDVACRLIIDMVTAALKEVRA